MKINITNEQYKELIDMLALSNGIVGVLGDALSDKDYKMRSKKTDDLENYFLQFAKDFGCSELTQKSEYKDKIILDDEYYENKIMPIMTDFEELATYESLSNELAWRDFREKHSEEEIKEMEKENGGYFGVVLYDYEKKYWNEFDKNGYKRLEIKQHK